MLNPFSRYYHKNGEVAILRLIDSNSCGLGVQTFSNQNVKVQPDLNNRFFTNIGNHPTPWIVNTPVINFPEPNNYDVKIIPTQGRLTDIKGLWLKGAWGTTNQAHIDIDNTFLHQFPNIEGFGYDSYQYGRPGRLTTVITGDWTDIPKSIKYLVFRGDSYNANLYFGDMSPLVNLEVYYYESVSAVVGMRITIEGDVKNLPRSLVRFVETNEYQSGAHGALGSLTGKLSDMPPLITELHSVSKPNNIIGYEQRSFPTTMNRYDINGLTLTSAELDQFLIDISNVTTWVGFKTIKLDGNIGVRTSISDSAVATLQSKGVSLTISNN